MVWSAGLPPHFGPRQLSPPNLKKKERREKKRKKKSLMQFQAKVNPGTCAEKWKSEESDESTRVRQNKSTADRLTWMGLQVRSRLCWQGTK